MTHTPTPWKIKKTPDQVRKMGIDASDLFDIGDNIITVCSTAYNEEKVNGANAEFIVRACNAHDALVKAVEIGLMYAPEGLGSGRKTMIEALNLARGEK